jgi:hypothetical protein
MFGNGLCYENIGDRPIKWLFQKIKIIESEPLRLLLINSLVPNVFALCSRQVLNGFPSGSYYVPQVPNVFPNMLSIAPHFFSLSFAGGGGIFFFLPLFLTSSHQVPQVPNVFPKGVPNSTLI